MINLNVTLGEPIDEKIVLQAGDKPLLELTAYDYDGSELDTGYTGTLFVGRSGDDSDEWEIAEIVAVAPADNIFYFNLEEITYTRGNYQAYLFVENDTEATPVSDSVSYSYKNISIEVV